MTAGDGDVVDGFIEALLDDDAQTLYERAPCGYLSTTPDGTIIKANATLLTLTGHSREELVGRKRFVELLTAGGRIYHETHYAPMLRMQGVAREIALDLVCADGRRLPVLVNSVLERDEDGSPTVIRTAVFDASHRRRYEQELFREKERATALARTLQQTLIPPHVPDIDGLEVGAEYRPAGDGSEVGGTSTTSSRPVTTGSSSSGTSAAKAWRRRWSPPSPATPCAPQRSRSVHPRKDCRSSTMRCCGLRSIGSAPRRCSG